MPATASIRCLLVLVPTAWLSACRGGEREAPSDFAVITGTSVYAHFDSAGRSTEPILVHYRLTRAFTEATLEFLTRDSLIARYPLPDLSAGEHTITVPPGLWQADDPPTFSCSLGRAPILTQFVASVRNQEDTSGDTVSLYDYRPDPTPENSTIRIDAASGFRGKEIGVSAFNIRYPRKGRADREEPMPEVEILGTNLTDGMQVSCSRGEPAVTRATAVLRDVKVVSTISHEDNEDIPVLQAARFTVPIWVLEPMNTLRIVGVAAEQVSGSR